MESLKVDVLSSSEACVKWLQPKQPSSDILNYIVYYTADREGPLETWHYIKINGTSKTKVSMQ